MNLQKEADAVGDGHSVDTESLAGFLGEVRRLNLDVHEHVSLLIAHVTMTCLQERAEDATERQESDAQPSYSEASLQPAGEPSSGTEERMENGNSKVWLLYMYSRKTYFRKGTRSG